MVYQIFHNQEGTASTSMLRDCPDGYEEIAGGVCKKPGWSLKTTVKDFQTDDIRHLHKESYDRGQGVRPDTCTLSQADSFGPGTEEDNLNRHLARNDCS